MSGASPDFRLGERVLGLAFAELLKSDERTVYFFQNRQFKALLQSDRLEFLCEAHNGLSAKIVEEAGSKASGPAGSPSPLNSA